MRIVGTELSSVGSKVKFCLCTERMERCVSLGKVLHKAARLSPSTHGRSNRDVCWQESEYLKHSGVVSELDLLGKRSGVIAEGSVEAARVLMMKQFGWVIKRKRKE